MVRGGEYDAREFYAWTNNIGPWFYVGAASPVNFIAGRFITSYRNTYIVITLSLLIVHVFQRQFDHQVQAVA
jgi:hypothetical protein